MRIAFIIINISLCLILTVFGRPEVSTLEDIQTNHQPDSNNVEQYLEDGLDEIPRKKKSTVTTFCVEIRPVDEKPYQVCEPVTEKGGYNNPAPYFQQSGGFDHVKPEVSFDSGSSIQSKPAAAYSAPVKTYQSSGSSTASKPAYGAYRSTKPEREEEHEKINPARVSRPDLIDKSIHLPDKTPDVPQALNQYSAARKTQESDEENEELDSMRSAHHQEPYGYGSGYGSPTSLIPVTPAHHGHSGLVITCQPNLAGYAHSVPGPYHEGGHHGGIPAYNYRSANPSYGRPYPPYRLQPQSYGNYKPYASRPVYRPQAQLYKGPIYSNAYPHPTAAYKSPVNVSPSHVYKPEFHEASIPNEYPAYPPPLPPASLSPPLIQPQQAPPSIYQPPSAYQVPAAFYPPPPEASVSEYKPAYTRPSDYKPQVYAPVYLPPAAYRSVEDKNVENKVEPLEGKIDKEAYTLETMSKISDKNTKNSRWAGEIQSSRDNEARLADQGAWREAADILADPQGGWRAADSLAIPQGDWREAETAKATGNWRSEEEGTEMKEASLDKDKGKHGVQNWDPLGKGNFRNADNSLGVIENEGSIENKIEDNL